jgi:hypothetical protein
MPGSSQPPADVWYDASYKSGPYSYYENVKRQDSADYSGLFPEGWGQPGETPEGTTWNNVVAGRWLPLFLPEGYDGDIPGAAHPEVIIYANETPVKMRLDPLGQPGTPEVDQARWDEACRIAVESAGYTSGSPFAREIG